MKNGKQELEREPVHSNNDNDDEADEEIKNWSFKKKFQKFKSNITVEPLVACYILPSILASLAVQNLNLEKACRVNLGYGDDFCRDLMNHNIDNKTEESKVQALVANMQAWRLPVQTSIPAIMMLFVGAWSDKTKRRKPCMVFPIFGEIMTAVGLILCTYYFLQWPLEVAGVIEAVPPALTGGHSIMFLGVFSFLADNTSVKERTFRIGLVNSFISLAYPIGTAVSGILLHELGYYGVFSISLSFYLIALVYVSTRIKDKNPSMNEEDTGCRACTSVISYKFFLQTFNVATKNRNMKRRLRIILLILSYFVVAGPVHGTGQLIYLFARKKFEFNEVEYSVYSSYTIVINLVGVLFALYVFSKRYQMDDYLLATFAIISKIVASIAYAFVPTREWFYAAALIELIGGTAIIAMRSGATKLVDPDEIGKINSLFGICEALINAIYSPIFNLFYAATVENYPGAFFLLYAVLLTPSIGLFLYLYRLQKWEERLLKKDDDENHPTYESFEQSDKSVTLSKL